MKNKGIKMMILILVLFLLAGSLCSCGKDQVKNEKDKNTAMGRFLEEEITLPENISNIELAGRMKNGNLLILGTDEKEMEERRLFQSEDEGANWKELPLPEQLKMENCSYIYRGAISSDGQIFISGNFGNVSFDNWLFGQDGSGKKLSIDMPEFDQKEEDNMDTENFVTQAAFGDNGNLYVSDLKLNVYQINTDSGKIEETFENNDDWRFFGTGGGYLVMIGNKKVSLYDMDTGEALADDSVFSDEIIKAGIDTSDADTIPTVFAGDEKGIFYVNHEGVYYHSIGGSVTEQLINGELNTIGNPSTGLLNLWYVDKDHFILRCRDEKGNGRILKYSYSETTPTMPEKELKVYALEDSNEVRQAISLYQKNNQDVYVNLEIGKSGEDGITTDDALRTLNTNIMAGKGPDVLILDGMPVDSYIEKGLLTDLTDVKDTIAKQDGLFENISDIYKKDGKIYGLPSRFIFYYVQGTKDDLKNSGTLTGIAKQVKKLKETEKKKCVTLNLEKELLLKQLFYVESANLKNVDNTMNEQRLQNFYEAAKEIYDANEEGDGNKLSLNFEGAGKTIGTAACLSYLMKNISYNMGTVESYSDLMMLASVNHTMKKDNIDYQLLNGEEKKCFVPCLSAGISSKSENQELAKEFVSTLLGKEAGAVAGDGLPVNRKAYDQTIENAKEMGESSSISIGGGGDGEMFSLEMSSPTDEDIKTLNEIVESLDSGAWNDAVIEEMVVSQGEKYLDGSQSIAETVNNVMQKINLYLSE